ncbi:retrovirus-related pol polyprotein from transposon TNT 1-94 [Tanacetum coccineum]
MNQFCGMKGIKREFSVARTPQQNGVAKRKNRTLIEAARTMLADSLLPTTFWAEAVNTACYVQNRVLVTKPHNKTPYELLLGRPPSISFMRPFGCPVTILNTLDPLGKFDGKADEGFLVGYSINNKAFRVFNTRTRKVEENLHINFLENKPQCIETNVNARQAGQEKASDHEYILLRLILSNSPLSSSTQSTDDKDVDEVLDKGDDDENRLERGTIDKTLFIKKDKDNAQEIPDDFYGELTFFLGLQTASTPMEPNKALVKDEEADNAKHIDIWYALTESPTIYVSLIEQFWKTASASTLKNGDIEITATIDGKVKGDGSTIQVESHHTPINAPSTSQPPTSSPSMQTTHVAEEAATMPHDLPLLITLESELKQIKLTYGTAYTKLIMKVKKLEHKGRKISQIDEDEGITLPDISTANVPVSTAGVEVSTASPKVKIAAESLVYIRRSAAKRKDKGKAIIKEAEPVQKKTKLQLEQERLGLKEALRLQEQLDEEERQRIARVHEEASTFNAEEWDNIQAQIEADEELAHRLQAQERERYSEADKARLLVELINERKRQFSQQRAEQRRNKPMTQAQQRIYMFKELFKTIMKRVNTLTPMESDDTLPKVVAGSSKIDAEQELNQESSKRQKIGEGSEPAEESKDELSQEQLQ